MIETFYEQIREFGEQINLRFSDIADTVETYIVFDTKIEVYLKQGKPIMIIVSE